MSLHTIFIMKNNSFQDDIYVYRNCDGLRLVTNMDEAFAQAYLEFHKGHYPFFIDEEMHIELVARNIKLKS